MESDYASQLFQYIQNVRSSRSKRQVVFSKEMEYTKGKTKVYLTPAKYMLTDSHYPVPSDALLNSRERLLWGDKPDFDSHKRDFSKFEKERKAYEDMQIAKEAVMAGREKEVVELKAAEEEYRRHMTELYDTGMADGIDPVERSKIWLQRNKFQKEYDPVSKQQSIHQAEAILHNPVLHLLTPGEVHMGAKPKKKAESDEAAEKAEKPEPVIYAETPNPVPIPALLIPKPSKETAKKQWVKDVLSSTGFMFKTQEECSTKRRLAEYYMSKEDILRVLAQHPDVIADLPPNYLSATKEGLCDMLFKSS